MPKKVLPKRFDYQLLTSFLKQESWFEVGSREENQYLDEIGIDRYNPPRQQESARSDLFINYNIKGYHGLIRTSISSTPTYQVAKSKHAWVLIVLGGNSEKIYSSQPIHRTKNFLTNLRHESIIIQTAIKERPAKEGCGYLELHKVSARLYIWVKPGTTEREYMFHEPFFKKLPRETQLYLNRKLSKDKYYKKYCDEHGIEYGSASRLRRKWEKKTETA